MDLNSQLSSHEVAHRLQQARAARDRGDLDAAVAGFAAVLRARPHLLTVEGELARLRLQSGDADAVVRQVRQRQAFGVPLENEDDWQELEALMLEALLIQERWAEAEPLLRSRMARGLASAPQALALSRAYGLRGLDDQCLEVLASALEHDPSALEIQLELASRLRELGRWREAVAAYGRALALAPEREDLLAQLQQVERDALWQRGEDALAAENWSEAERAFRSLADLDPDHPLAWQRLDLLARLSPLTLDVLTSPGLREAGSWSTEAEERLRQFSRLLDRLESTLAPRNQGPPAP
jgi:tetratricopeptide (TPR) repeat protein